MKKSRTLETMMEESSWPSRSRWKARVGSYGEGFLETRSLGSSILGNMMDCGVNERLRCLRGEKASKVAIEDSSSKMKIEKKDRRRLGQGLRSPSLKDCLQDLQSTCSVRLND